MTPPTPPTVTCRPPTATVWRRMPTWLNARPADSTTKCSSFGRQRNLSAPRPNRSSPHSNSCRRSSSRSLSARRISTPITSPRLRPRDCCPTKPVAIYCATHRKLLHSVSALVTQARTRKTKEPVNMIGVSLFSRESAAAPLSTKLVAVVSLLLATCFAGGGAVRDAAARQAPSTDAPQGASQPNPLRPLAYRQIGPFRGGRVTAVAGVTSQPFVYYFGATGGGVWKTTDGGATWEPISDNSVFGTGSVGAIGICESDPNVIYVGMGESPVRGNVSHGDGVYKSLDAGKTWKRV